MADHYMHNHTGDCRSLIVSQSEGARYLGEIKRVARIVTVMPAKNVSYTTI